MNIGVVAAMPQEFTTLSTETDSYQQPVQISTDLCGIMSGMGPKNATAAAQRLYQFNQSISGIISWGVAAALTAELACGHITLPQKVITSDCKSHNLSGVLHSYLCNEISRHLTLETDLLHAETKNMLGSTADKAELHQKTNAHSADMESGALLRFCEKYQLDFAAVRVISDDAQTSIPEIIGNSSRADGQMNVVKLLGLLLRHPSQLPQLIKVAKDFSKARQKLSKISKLIKAE